MAPPKCFFKRPEEFYANGGMRLQPPKLEYYSQSNSPSNDSSSSSPRNMTKTEPLVYRDFCPSRSPQSVPLEPTETPLDLSRKYVDENNNELLKQLSSILLQHQTSIPNHYLNFERLFQHLPQLKKPSFTSSIPNLYVTPPFGSKYASDPEPQSVDPSHLSVYRTRDNRIHHSPESVRDNSSSETSSQYTTLRPKNRTSKRKNEGKVLRPFKLYKGNDSEGLMEALGICEEDEEWLKTIVEYKSVDDVFLFLTNCMNDSTKPTDLSDEIIEKVKMKFGHIFQNCNMTVSNPKMVRHPDMTPKELKTDEYWDKRRKNNEAAKRSREARRHKEENLNQHCEKLQTENDFLRKEIERIKVKIEEKKRTRS